MVKSIRNWQEKRQVTILVRIPEKLNTLFPLSICYIIIREYYL